MLLPEPVRDLSMFADRPRWSVVTRGRYEPREGSAVQLDAMGECSLVVARRRHGSWHGPLAGFAMAPQLKLARLVELVDVDVCPWVDEDAAAYFDAGLEAVLEYVRLFGAQAPRWQRGHRAVVEGVVVPPGVGGPKVREWVERFGSSA